MSSQSAGGEMTPARFIAKWSRTALAERAASQEHFLDLCRLLGQPTPAEHDATGAEYAFEKGVAVAAGASRGAQGQRGFADVWWRGKFGWEYKRKDKYRDLAEAYRQLCQYREALDNPPLLVVSDIARTEIHTNFTGTSKQVHVVLLHELGQPDKLSLLRRLFTDPESFRPTITTAKVTEQVAQYVASLSAALQGRGHTPHAAARFLMKCMFCLFAEDVDLLPGKLFTRLLRDWHGQPAELTGRLTELFAKMRTGGAFGPDRIPWFNGGLFDEAPALPLDYAEVGLLCIASQQDWGSVEPAIFGTLFERSLDPGKRAQIGAHYTSRDDIMLVIEPVILAPLRTEWQAVQAEVQNQLDRRRSVKAATKKKANQAIQQALAGFLHRLSQVRVLDPACGSGNFLYVAIQQLLDLEKEVITFAARPEIGLGLFPTVRPTQLHGIEINPYAAELAQVVIWIGYLQWMRDNGFNAPRDPILQPLQTVENRDAILSFADHPQTTWAVGRPPEELRKGQPASWPDAHFIIGNPPFLGSKLMRANGLPDDYIAGLHQGYSIPRTSDLCCYWFERARMQLEFSRKYGGKGYGHTPYGFGPFGRSPATNVRTGLLATQGIRGGDNRTVLERIKQTGDIFMAWSDREWVLDGANVHVSIIGFDNGSQVGRILDGAPVREMNANLTSGDNLVAAAALPENLNIAFMGTTKGGAFDIEWAEARHLLSQPNPNKHPNLDVVKPWVNGIDITQRTRAMWVIDFGCETTESSAAGYEEPFELAKKRVFPERSKIRQAAEARIWWLHNRPRPEMRSALRGLPRFIVTTRVAKHRMFRWFANPMLPDSATFAFARSDDYFFGVLHSSVHELWALRMGTQLEDRPRYTPTTCFETFALPWPPGKEPVLDPAGGAQTPLSPEGEPAKAASQPPQSKARRYSSPSGRGRSEGPGEGSCRTPTRPCGPTSPSQGEALLVEAIAAAAKELNEQRERWLNPPEWIGPLTAGIDEQDDFHDVPAEARALVRQSAIMAAAAKHPLLKKRTLTNLYNERPTWLRLAHRRLDEAVLAAYAAVDPAGGWPSEWAAVWEDTGAGQPLGPDHPLAARRAEVDQQVLANLLRLNQQRA